MSLNAGNSGGWAQNGDKTNSSHSSVIHEDVLFHMSFSLRSLSILAISSTTT